MKYVLKVICKDTGRVVDHYTHLSKYAAKQRREGLYHHYGLVNYDFKIEPLVNTMESLDEAADK